MMKIPFILLLSFLTMVACSNGQSKKRSLNATRPVENIDSIDIAKKMKVSKDDIDDSLFLKRIIDGPFF